MKISLTELASDGGGQGYKVVANEDLQVGEKLTDGIISDLILECKKYQVLSRCYSSLSHYIM